MLSDDGPPRRPGSRGKASRRVGRGCGNGQGQIERLTSGFGGRGWPSRQRVAKIGFLNVQNPLENAEWATRNAG